MGNWRFLFHGGGGGVRVVVVAAWKLRDYDFKGVALICLLSLFGPKNKVKVEEITRQKSQQRD